MKEATAKSTKGERTRAAILQEAAHLATIEGLEGLSIGGLAAATGMSKSGLYAHFGSKLELQLATIDAARETFLNEVLRPAFAAPEGLQRLLATCEGFLSYVERRVFPGGCFFVAAASEVGASRGPVRDSIAAQQRAWDGLLEQLARQAIDRGELDPGTDPAQLAFELHAVMAAANASVILHDDDGAIGRARMAIGKRLQIE